MKNISIFARPARFYQKTGYYDYPHLQRGSSMIRGEQMAEWLGAKYNPARGYENDVRIYVKPGELRNISPGSYIDIVDSQGWIMGLLKRPDLKIIVCSMTTYNYFKRKGHKNEIFFIPQHHCNFDNVRRDRKEITTVGMIGSRDSFNYSHNKFREQMKAIGLDFVANFSFRSRQEVVKFYKGIDIQVSWNIIDNNFKNPLRLVNAASFGIPTVAYPEVGFSDFKGYYIEARTIEDLIKEVEKLRKKEYYREWSEKIVKKAEEFHISKIAEMYRQLL